MPVKMTAKRVLSKFRKKRTSLSKDYRLDISEREKLIELYAKHAANISYFVRSEEGELDRMISTTRPSRQSKPTQSGLRVSEFKQ
jgi:hypothetical protein